MKGGEEGEEGGRKEEGEEGRRKERRGVRKKVRRLFIRSIFQHFRLVLVLVLVLAFVLLLHIILLLLHYCLLDSCEGSGVEVHVDVARSALRWPRSRKSRR